MRHHLPRFATVLLSLATAATALSAQAPIERAASPRPLPGVFLHTGRNTYVHTLESTADHVELRVERGIANIRVDHPAEGTLILVDLPGGQVDLLKDGFYTFNAETNTFRVMDGEATAYPTANSGKELKVKSAQEVVFNAQTHTADFERAQAQTDLLPYNAPRDGEYASGEGYAGPTSGYGYGFYDYDYPYSAYGYGYGYPYGYYGYGYPYAFGLGFGYGYYGGFYGGGYGYRGGFGGYRGGYGGGFHSGFGGSRGGFGHR